MSCSKPTIFIMLLGYLLGVYNMGHHRPTSKPQQTESMLKLYSTESSRMKVS